MSLYEFVKSLRNSPPDEITRLSEFQARKRILEPMLRHLGWDTDAWGGEVVEEYELENRKVDYCLRIGNINKVFIEAKKPAVNPSGHHRQLIDYSFTGGARIAILTNCIQWLFFLPLSEGPWQQRMFYRCDILSDELDVLVESLGAFLSREKVVSGHAADAAENYLRGRQRENFVNHSFPEAWKKLVFSKDERFIEFFSDIVEQDWGERPQRSDVEAFLDAKIKLYEKVEEREAKNRQKGLRSGEQQRHQPASASRQINAEFNKIILDDLFDQAFSRVGRFTTMYESQDNLICFRNCITQEGNPWYRVEKKEWKMLQEDRRNALLIFTNAAVQIGYVIPVQDVIRQVDTSGWDRDYLEVNFDSANDRWRELDWNIRGYIKRFPRDT